MDRNVYVLTISSESHKLITMSLFATMERAIQEAENYDFFGSLHNDGTYWTSDKSGRGSYQFCTISKRTIKS